MADCGADAIQENKTGLNRLKVAALFAILVASVAGVCLPIIAGKASKSGLFFAGKCFAAGVVLATGFVHMLPDAFDSLGNSCLPDRWTHYPYAAVIAMLAAIATLLADATAMSFYSIRQASKAAVASDALGMEENGHFHGRLSDSSQNLRQKVVAQVLELGILAHSVIIGISLGTSNQSKTIKPLMGALIFHQFFEGLALGGCISLAGFKRVSAALMALFFSITTPLGVAIGIGISSTYNENSPRALIVEGIFDSMSAGILIYMALVDLIAHNFLNDEEFLLQPMRQVRGYIFLIAGAAAMAVIAIWA